MNKTDLVKYLLKHNYLHQQKYIYEVAGILDTYELFYVKGNLLYLKENDEVITFYKKGEPLLLKDDEINLNPDDMRCISKPITTTFGKVIFNSIIIDKGLSSKLPYQNEVVSLNKFTGTKVRDALRDDVITIEDFNMVSVTITSLRSLSKLFVVADTLKTMQPPPNIIKLRDAKIKELKGKYGEEALSDYEHLTALTNYLKEIDDEWLKDDPTTGVMTSGKVKNVSRVKKFMLVGDEQGLTGDGLTPNTILHSLSEGHGRDPKELALQFDGIRGGSYSRGAETRLGGEEANIIMLAMSDFRITDTVDCGTKEYSEILVTKDNLESLKDRTIVKGKLAIDNIVGYRNPMFCLEPDGHYCQTCVSKTLSKDKDGIALMMLDIAGNLVDSFLAKIHSSSISMHELELGELNN